MTDTSPSPPQIAAAPPRGRRWLLVGSLALNLLFIGGLTALWFKAPPMPGHPGPTQTAFGLLRFSRDLPPERRNAVRRHLKEARQEVRSLRDDLLAKRKAAAEVLASPSYTAEQMQAALAAVAAADDRIRDTGMAAMIKAIGELTAEERQKLAAAWSRRLDWQLKRRSKPEQEGRDESPPP